MLPFLSRMLPFHYLSLPFLSHMLPFHYLSLPFLSRMLPFLYLSLPFLSHMLTSLFRVPSSRCFLSSLCLPFTAFSFDLEHHRCLCAVQAICLHQVLPNLRDLEHQSPMCAVIMLPPLQVHSKTKGLVCSKNRRTATEQNGMVSPFSCVAFPFPCVAYPLSGCLPPVFLLTWSTIDAYVRCKPYVCTRSCRICETWSINRQCVP